MSAAPLAIAAAAVALAVCACSHADGAAPSGRGFTVLEPVAVGPNDAVIAAFLRSA